MGTNTITYQKTSDTPDVAFFSVPAANSGNSGDGQVIVGNIHYTWNSAEGGFTDSRWWGTEVEFGPTRLGDFTSDEDVTRHLQQPGANLNAAFQAWQNYIDSQPVLEQSGIIDAFNDALVRAGGGSCAV